MSDCYPSWHATYAPLAAQSWTKAIIPSSCSVNSAGNIPCSPESMRASAEAWLARNAPQALTMIGGRLSLDVYTYARYMHSEVGSGTIEERVAVGEALRNRTGFGKSIYQLLTPSGYYGPIHAPQAWCEANGYNCAGKANTCCAPFKRWAATSRDPSVMSLMLAALVAGGGSNDFAQGADDQAGVNTIAWVQYLAKQGKYWIGPLPGVDHRHTFLVFTPNPAMRALAGKALLDRGMSVIGKPPPSWAGLPICSGAQSLVSSRRAQMFFISMLGISAGAIAAHFAAKRLVHPV